MFRDAQKLLQAMLFSMFWGVGFSETFILAPLWSLHSSFTSFILHPSSVILHPSFTSFILHPMKDEGWRMKDEGWRNRKGEQVAGPQTASGPALPDHCTCFCPGSLFYSGWWGSTRRPWAQERSYPSEILHHQHINWEEVVPDKFMCGFAIFRSCPSR